MALHRKTLFEKIYKEHFWGGNSCSGPGSDSKSTVDYVNYVNEWLFKRKFIKRIVEVGCGDWATTRLLNFNQKTVYIGIDIVEEIVDRNQRRFATNNIAFKCLDFLEEVTPVGDLLIAKDVLQHLSNDNVKYFLENILPRYRYALITNDLAKYKEKYFLGLGPMTFSLSKQNENIKDGESRSLNLSIQPFLLKGIKDTFEYSVFLRNEKPRIIYKKEIIAWERD